MTKVRIAGDAAWWVFVVAGMLGGLRWMDDRPGWAVMVYIDADSPRYADYLGPAYSETVLTAPSTYAVAGFAVLVGCAVAEAVLLRALPLAAVATVAVPLLAVLPVAVVCGAWPWGPVTSTFQALLLILLGIAIREVWRRRLAPAHPA
ncbi:hypothetical protein [Nocardia sp. NPDC057353]|uniref:hypothetical protein n=1 Tax=Nocardia sp. NPDC057353 TaxID=3346104 RepID=UPI00362BDEB2